jgi:hypothetical protein
MGDIYKVYKREILVSTIDQNGNEVDIHQEHACNGHEHVRCIMQEWYSKGHLTYARILGYSETCACDGACQAVERSRTLGEFSLPDKLGVRRHFVG